MFDKATIDKNRSRAREEYHYHDFLFQEIANRLSERINEINREFPLALGVCWNESIINKNFQTNDSIGKLIQCTPHYDRKLINVSNLCIEAENFPFAPNTIDLTLSLLDWHWVNDLPGLLFQTQLALKPDGLLLGAMFGGETLHELRTAFIEAELAIEGGAAPRVSAFVNAETLGSLLQRAGFALPVVDVDTIKVTYPNAFKLMQDLRGMGEGNSMSSRRKNFSRRDTFVKASEIYQNRFGTNDGLIEATFQIIYATAWAPHASQPKPAVRGSGQQSLEKVIKNS